MILKVSLQMRPRPSAKRPGLYDCTLTQHPPKRKFLTTLITGGSASTCILEVVRGADLWIHCGALEDRFSHKLLGIWM